MRMFCTSCKFEMTEEDLPNWFQYGNQPTPWEKAADHANETSHIVQIVEAIGPEGTPSHIVNALKTVNRYFNQTEG